MKYGWIKINISDMWLKPQYNSERVNQLLFLDFVKILDEKNNFCLVEKYDKYQGWVDKRFIAGCTNKQFKQFQEQKKYVITAKTLKLSAVPHFLYYGTTLSGTKVKNNKLKVLFPNTDSILISLSGLKLIPKNKIKASLILSEAKRFLGVPYLWGGLSSAGYDCSGFTQMILSRFGIQIPRDTKDQIKIGMKISRENIQNGDLLFFDRHVGFAIGKNKIIHSSVGGGGVRINSLSPNQQEYRKDLDESFKTARRII